MNLVNQKVKKRQTKKVFPQKSKAKQGKWEEAEVRVNFDNF
jgi:hypothetical protein